MREWKEGSFSEFISLPVKGEGVRKGMTGQEDASVHKLLTA